MLKLLKLLFILIILAALGVAGWYFLSDEDVPILRPRFPKQLEGLQQTININDNGVLYLQAGNRADLVFAQGYVHGKEVGRLTALRDLFLGKPDTSLPPHLRQLAQLFYCLDLHHVAEKSLDLYPPTLKVILRQYASGLTAGSGKPWTETEVLVMQRGYAFLLGHNFAKEWAANLLLQKFGSQVFRVISPWPQGGFGGVDVRVLLSSELYGLFSAPMMETVRFSGTEGWGFQTRCDPALAFVFMPMALESTDGLKAWGLSLAGTPFLWAGANDQVAFHLQPVLANDDQFHQVPGSLFVGREKALFRNESAPHAASYDYAPVHTEYGRSITPLTSGVRGMEYYYFWQGLRPSMDLAAFYYLMQAQDLGEARAAWQYHQTPSGQLTLAASGRRSITLSLGGRPGENDSRLSRNNRLFRRPYLQRNVRRVAVRGFDFESVSGNGSPTPGDSVLDQDLAALLSLYLDGPLLSRSLTDARRMEMRNILAKPSLKRDYLMQLIWQEMINALREQFFPDESEDYLVRASDLPLKRFVLSSLGNRDDNGSWKAAPLESRMKLLETVLKRAHASYRKAAGGTPPWPYLMFDASGEDQTIHTDVFGISRDSVNEAFQVFEGNRITQVTTHAFHWDDNFAVHIFGMADSGKPGAVEKAVRPASSGGKEYRINPQ